MRLFHEGDMTAKDCTSAALLGVESGGRQLGMLGSVLLPRNHLCPPQALRSEVCTTVHTTALSQDVKSLLLFAPCTWRGSRYSKCWIVPASIFLVWSHAAPLDCDSV
jgi:hypothetical protein